MLGNKRTFFFFVNYGLHVLFLTMNEMYFIFTEIIYIHRNYIHIHVDLYLYIIFKGLFSIYQHMVHNYLI